MFTKEKVLEALRWAILGRFIAQMITWSVSLLVLRFLSPDDYGSFMVSQLLISLLILIAVLGIDKIIVQASKISEIEQRQLLLVMILAAWFACFMIMYFASNIASFYEFDDLSHKVSYLALALVVTPWLVLAESNLDRELRFKEKSVVNLSVAVFCALLTLVLIFLGNGIWSLIISYLCQRLLLCIFYCIIAKTPLLPVLSLSNLRSFWAIGGLFLLGDIVWMLTQSIDGLLGAKWYSVEVYGYFALATHLANLILNKLMPVFNQTLMTFIARIQDDIESVFATLKKVVNLSNYVCIPIFWGLAVSAQNLLALVFGDTWQQSALIMTILCAFIPLKVMNSLVSMTLLGLGKARWVLYVRTINLSILVILLFLFKSYSFYGLVYAVVVSFCLHLLLNIWLIRKVFSQFLFPQIKPFLFGTIMVLACLTVDAVLYNKALALCLQVVVGAGIYILMMQVFEKKVSQEMMSWIK